MAKVEAERCMALKASAWPGLWGVMRAARLKRGIKAAGLAVLVALCVPSTRGLAADDGGLGAFFRDQFGLGSDAQPQAPVYDMPEDRPVTVRPKRRHVVSRRPTAKIAVGPVAPVSIYDDRTLKAGDAVMTKTGVRVFLGGHGAPYTEADFASLSDAEGLPRQVQKALLVIDKAPRG